MGIDSRRRHCNFPESCRACRKTRRLLEFIEDIYQSDAYHSLSIEGYSVTPALIDG